jgi:alpha-ketoglutarate-dependent taurine dioxygenase
LGVVPERTSDPRAARDLLSRDGAAILIWSGSDAADAEAGAVAVLGERLRRYRRSVDVGTNPAPGQPTFFDRSRRMVNADATTLLGLHVDGYMTYGAAYPDAIFLLCVRQSPTGGDSVIVDGYRLLDSLAAAPGQQDLFAFIETVPVEQSTPTGVPVQAPIAARTPAGRIALRCHEHQRPAAGLPLELANSHQMMIDRWRVLAAGAGEAAPRFRMQPGDLLCLDNYRVFHGREPYPGNDRLLRRIWAWTDRSFGLPEATLLGDERVADLVAVPA